MRPAYKTDVALSKELLMGIPEKGHNLIKLQNCMQLYCNIKCKRVRKSIFFLHFLSNIQKLIKPSWFTMTTPITPLCACILLMVSSTSVAWKTYRLNTSSINLTIYTIVPITILFSGKNINYCDSGYVNHNRQLLARLFDCHQSLSNLDSFDICHRFDTVCIPWPSLTKTCNQGVAVEDCKWHFSSIPNQSISPLSIKINWWYMIQR